MPNPLRKITSVKNHVVKHRAKYAALATASVFVGINLKNARDLDTFLIEKGIDPSEYWLPEYFAEKTA